MILNRIQFVSRMIKSKLSKQYPEEFRGNSLYRFIDDFYIKHYLK